ncbi:MAG: hypothetical protein ACM3O6_06545 [Acidobacteriota bacterium]
MSILTAPKAKQPNSLTIARHAASSPQPSAAQRAWLVRGLTQPGGKLPLFDEQGQRVSPRTIRACIEQGWAEPWFANPTKPDWLVCKLTDPGRAIARDQ